MVNDLFDSRLVTGLDDRGLDKACLRSGLGLKTEEWTETSIKGVIC